MARVKVWSENRTSLPLSAHVEFAINSLKTGLQHVDDHDVVEYRKISFIVEKLKLSLQSKYSRHYSPQLISISVVFENSVGSGAGGTDHVRPKFSACRPPAH